MHRSNTGPPRARTDVTEDIGEQFGLLMLPLSSYTKAHNVAGSGRTLLRDAAKYTSPPGLEGKPLQVTGTTAEGHQVGTGARGIVSPWCGSGHDRIANVKAGARHFVVMPTCLC